MSDIVTNEVKKELQRGLDIISGMDNGDCNLNPTPSNDKTNVVNSESLVASSSSSKEENINNNNTIQWLKTVELNYEVNKSNDKQNKEGATNTHCLVCGSNNIKNKTAGENNTTTTGGESFKKLLKCCKCHQVSYCSKECQILDWKSNKNSHKKFCKLYKQLTQQEDDEEISNQAKRKIREMLLSTIQIYANSYAVHNCFTHGIGRGFLFLQSTLSLQQLLFLPKYENDSSSRSLLLHYLTLGEYDQEICREDFELALIRKELVSILDTYDHYKQVIYVLKFRCGHIAMGCIPIKPDVGICKNLAKGYFSHLRNQDALQLNIDNLEN